MLGLPEVTGILGAGFTIPAPKASTLFLPEDSSVARLISCKDCRKIAHYDKKRTGLNVRSLIDFASRLCGPEPVGATEKCDWVDDV